MTMEKTKAQLTHLLADKDNKVIALTGKWGTGKSYLWNEVKNESKDDAVKKTLYVSLFGLSDMNQVKFKLLQSAIPGVKENRDLFNKTKILWNNGIKFLRALDGRFAAIDNLQLLVVPNLLKGKVIVFDDIERKHEKLHIDEILGFIDEYTQQNGARFVLIFNSDKLVDVDLWNTFREKVVDQEIRLNTSPSEAFDIAINLLSSHYEKHIRTASDCCGLTNIRIICKVIKVMNNILNNRTDLSDTLLQQIIPSTVLLAATHYKGIVDGPDFDFILKYNSILELADDSKQQAVEDEESQKKSKWKKLFESLQYEYYNDYVQLVYEYLQSGLFNSSKLNEMIDAYAKNANYMILIYEIRDLDKRLNWDSQISEFELLSEAKNFLPKVHLLEDNDITRLCYSVREISGGSAVENDMLHLWIKAFRSKNTNAKKHYFANNVHPVIQAEYDNIKITTQLEITLSEAISFFANGERNDSSHEVIKSATVEDFEITIRSLSGDTLKVVMKQMISVAKQRRNYEDTYGNASDYFVQACKNIVNDTNSGRLGKIIQREFTQSKINHFLE